MLVITPSRGRIREIQEKEQKLYWSAAAEALLRGRGVISISTITPPARAPIGPTIVTRGCGTEVLSAIGSPGPWFFEGPLNPDLAQSLGVGTRSWQATEATLLWGEESPRALRYPIEYWREPSSDERVPLTEPTEWCHTGIEGQFIDGKDWTVLATAELTDSNQSGPVIVARGSTILCGLPILDIGVRHNAVPPLPTRYVGRDPLTGHAPVLDQIIGLLVRASSVPVVTVRRWPTRCRAAVTIRHDYDRDISADSALSLLNYYNARGLKCSIGFLAYLAPPQVVNAFAVAGHEIQLHSHARDGLRLGEAKTFLEAISGRPIRGMTIHGGGTGIGFLGDTHYEWSLASGLDYAELKTDASYPVSPIPRIGSDGIPCASCLLGITPHKSLDVNMKPEGHYLELRKTEFPQYLSSGAWFIVMNHPDLHRVELFELLDTADLSGVWHSTQGEVARWFRLTHYEAEPEIKYDRVRLDFGEALPAPVEITIHWPDQTKIIATIEGTGGEVLRGGPKTITSWRPDAEPSRSRLYTKFLDGYAGHTPIISPTLHGVLPRPQRAAEPTRRSPAAVPEYRHGPAFAQSYFEDRTIGEAVAQSDHRNLGFRGILQCLRLPEPAQILDVGAGGFAGATTTVHLAERYPKQVYALEIRPERAGALCEKFGSRINIDVGDFYGCVLDKLYDLIVLDLDSGGLPRQYYEAVPRAHSLLKEGGTVIASVIYDLSVAFHADAPLFKADTRASQENFMLDYFGTTSLDLETAQRVMWRHGFAALGIIDKWMTTAPGRGFGWIVLEKL